VEPFTLNLAQVEPKTFITRVLLEQLGAAAVVVGYDFTFGVHRRGTADVLKVLGKEHGIDVHIVEAQFHDELLISSTEIRHAVSDGNMPRARMLMDNPFALRGTVVAGHGIGETLGAHTANLVAENELMPREGVYVTTTSIVGDEHAVPSITSVGTNPTFKGRGFVAETHLLDFEGDLVNAHLEVSFYERLRGQIAFDSPATLKGQIAQDIVAARRWHEHNNL
jgi:riboflavin kinase/FMN adenylyltransferase